MRVGEHDAVGRRQTGEIVAAFGELVRPLAVGRPVLGHRLVERHQRPAAAMGEQYDFGNAGLPAQERDAGLHVERQLFEIHLRFVVLVARVHAKHQKTAPRQFRAGAVVEIVRGAVHRQNADMRRRTGIGPVERAFGYPREGDELRTALRTGKLAPENQGQRSGDDDAQHWGCSEWFGFRWAGAVRNGWRALRDRITN